MSYADLDRVPDKLLMRVAHGDEQAFESLYDRVGAPVAGLVHLVLVDHAQAEAVTLEIWRDVWRQATRYRADRGPAISWIMNFAHRRAVDQVRSRAATSRQASAGLPGARTSPEDLADVAIQRSRQKVEDVLRHLTAAERQAITMAYFQGMTCEEISSALDVPLDTAQKRVRDGLVRLREPLRVATMN